MTTPQEEQCEMSTKIGDDTDTVGNIEKFLQECLEGMEPDHKLKGPGRPRVLPAMALWAGCVLRGFGSQLAVWRLISERGLWSPDPGYRPSGLQAAPYRGDQALFERQHRVGRTIAGCVLGEAGALCRGRGVHRREYHWVEKPERGPSRRQPSAPWQAV